LQPCKGGPADIDRELAGRMVDGAIAGGGNYLDTVWMYHAPIQKRLQTAGLALLYQKYTPKCKKNQ
jgi:predicted aldo/keto reductase-like oxidoreductase